MPAYAYKAYSAKGEHITGKCEADSEKHATEKLVADGLSPYSILISRKDIASISFQRPGSKGKLGLSHGEQSSFYSGLAVLLENGFVLDDALVLSQKIEPNKKIKAAYAAVRAETSQGTSLAKGLETSLQTPSHVTAIIESSEASGALKHALRQIADDFDTMAKTKEETQQALTYPAFLVGLLIVVLTLLSIQLVPALIPIFSGNNAQIPTIIKYLHDVGEFFTQNTVPVIAGFCFFTLIIAIGPVRHKLAQFLILVLRKLPLIGPFLKKSVGARYLRTLALLTESSVPIKDGLELAAKGVALKQDRIKFDEVVRLVSEGENLSTALSKTNMLADYVVSLIAIGEESDNLGQMILQGSLIEERQVRKSIASFLGALSPVLTIAIGILVGGVVVSVMSALLNLNEVVLR